MREASCGSMMPAIIIHYFVIYYLFSIYYLVSAAAVACVKHPTGHAIFSIILFIVIYFII
jgi:hypothetical protein